MGNQQSHNPSSSKPHRTSVAAGSSSSSSAGSQNVSGSGPGPGRQQPSGATFGHIARAASKGKRSGREHREHDGQKEPSLSHAGNATSVSASAASTPIDAGKPDPMRQYRPTPPPSAGDTTVAHRQSSKSSDAAEGGVADAGRSAVPTTPNASSSLAPGSNGYAVALRQAQFARPPRLPLPIGEELHTPGSPIMSPVDVAANRHRNVGSGEPEPDELGPDDDETNDLIGRRVAIDMLPMDELNPLLSAADTTAYEDDDDDEIDNLEEEEEEQPMVSDSRRHGFDRDTAQLIQRHAIAANEPATITPGGSVGTTPSNPIPTFSPPSVAPNSTTGTGSAASRQDPVAFIQPIVVPTVIEWRQGGTKVYVTGTFAGWDRKYRLLVNGPSKREGALSAVINLPPGTHHLKFIVDAEMRLSDHLPTAVDFTNMLVNYIEVSTDDLPKPPKSQPIEIPAAKGTYPASQDATDTDRSAGAVTARPSATAPTPGMRIADTLTAAARQAEAQFTIPADVRASRRRAASGADQSTLSAAQEGGTGQGSPDYDFQRQDPVAERAELFRLKPEKYHSHIPRFLLHLDAPEESGRFARSIATSTTLPAPPTLPLFLAKSILNMSTPMKDDSSVLMMPNHTVLNHLATSSIRSRVLATSATTRYRRKFLTTIMYKPTSNSAE